MRISNDNCSHAFKRNLIDEKLFIIQKHIFDMNFKKFTIFLIILTIILLSGCGQSGDKDEVEEPPTIIPAPVGEISKEELALLEVNETECNSGKEFVPKVKYTWKWSEINPDFCGNYYCDATQFSIVLLKKINIFIENKAVNEEFEFEALLMKEGFSGNFQKDFDDYMRQRNFLDTPSFYLNEELGEIFPDKEKFVFTASEIERPGKYKIKVSSPTKSSDQIIVEFKLISSEGVNNPFYYLPFNGKIGEKRQGYGLGYNISNETSQVMVSEELSLSNQSPATGKFNATVKKIQDFGIANAPTTRGNILKVEADPLGKNRTIEFSPLLATPVLMHSKVNISNANSVALLYRISDQGITEINTGDSFLLWQPLEQCIVYDNSTAPFQDTRNTGEPNSYMIFNDLSDFVEEEKIIGDVYYKSIVYTPRQVTLTSLGTYIDNRITKQSILEFKTPFTSAETVSLNGAPGILHDSAQDIIQSLEQTFESIRNGEMCIQKTGDAENLEVKVYWNEQKLFERIGSQTEVAQQQCNRIGQIMDIEIFYNEFTLPTTFSLGENRYFINIADSRPPEVCGGILCYTDFDRATCDKIESVNLIVLDEFGNTLQQVSVEKLPDFCDYKLEIFFGEEFEDKKFKVLLKINDVSGKNWDKPLGEFENIKDSSLPLLLNRKLDSYSTWPLNLFFAVKDNFKLDTTELEITTSSTTYQIPLNLEKKLNERKEYYSATFVPNDSDEEIIEYKFILTDNQGNINEIKPFEDATPIEILADNFKCEKIFGTAPNNIAINVVLFVSKFSQEEVELTKFNDYHEKLFEKIPFDTRKDNFNFFLLTSANEFGTPAISHSIVKNECELDFLDQDQVILLLKDSFISTGGGGRAAVSVPDPLTNTHYITFMHEFGHSFGRLADEYRGSNWYKRFSSPVFDPDRPYGINKDIEGCPRWCNGQLNEGSDAFQYYVGYMDCVEPYKHDPTAEEYNDPLLYCWDFWSKELNEEYTSNIPLDDPGLLLNIDLGSDCREQTGCYLGAGGMGAFRSLQNGIMRFPDPPEARYGVVSEEFMVEWIDNYNSPQIQNIILESGWG